MKSSDEPQSIEECDERLAFLSELSAKLGLPVEGENGADGLDELLDLRNKLSNE